MNCKKMKIGEDVFDAGRPRDHQRTRDDGRPRNRQRTRDDGRTQVPGRSPKKGISFITKAMDSVKNFGRSKTPPPRWSSNEFDSQTLPSNHHDRYQLGTRTAPAIRQVQMQLPRVVNQDTRNQSASSSHGDRNGSRETDVYQIRAPPPGSYQDDDTGPSPKNLVMAVMGVKSAVNHFAKALISHMTKYPEHLRNLKPTILQEVQAEVDRANHWKFLVQTFVCKRLFEGFETENGFFGIKYFDGWTMTPFVSFADFSKFKDKAGTISGLLAKDSADVSFLGKFCFEKFMSITGDSGTNQPLPLYEEEWSMVVRDRHPQSEFYQGFLKVAVSVWLLHRLVRSFEQEVKMLGWETFSQGCNFQRKYMESVVPGGFEEEDEETGTDVSTVVGFLVIPGFQVSKSVVKCEVYLRNKNSVNDGKIVEATEMPSRKKSFDKSFSDKTPASYQTPEKSLSDRSPGSLQTPDNFKSSSNYSDHLGQTAADNEGVNYCYSQTTRDSTTISPRSKSGESRYFMAASAASGSSKKARPPGQAARPPGGVTRSTFSSRQKEEMAKRHT